MSHPYETLAPFHFWSKSVTAPAPGRIDPVVTAPVISPDETLATMGSCFAQHLSRFIVKSGLKYRVDEPPPPELSATEATRRNYGVFSARYGNVYTVRQALQLFDRAFGTWHPAEEVWQRGDRYVDPFRPRIEPDGFAQPEAVLEESLRHLDCVRKVFTESHWLVLTLGLTEAWRSREDGATYPLAPGVAGGSYDPARHEFVNFTAAEVSEDLARLVTRINGINPACRLILTVSPVPLIATYEPRHVLVSTAYSKAALRVAADETARRFQNVFYFPSFEIITSPATGGRYYADDLREVTDIGVAHVMRVFRDHYLEGKTNPSLAPAATPFTTASTTTVVCDEETIEAALRGAGF